MFYARSPSSIFRFYCCCWLINCIFCWIFIEALFTYYISATSLFTIYAYFSFCISCAIISLWLFIVKTLLCWFYNILETSYLFFYCSITRFRTLYICSYICFRFHDVLQLLEELRLEIINWIFVTLRCFIDTANEYIRDRCAHSIVSLE